MLYHVISNYSAGKHIHIYLLWEFSLFKWSLRHKNSHFRKPSFFLWTILRQNQNRLILIIMLLDQPLLILYYFFWPIFRSQFFLVLVVLVLTSYLFNLWLSRVGSFIMEYRVHEIIVIVKHLSRVIVVWAYAYAIYKNTKRP